MASRARPAPLGRRTQAVAPPPRLTWVILLEPNAILVGGAHSFDDTAAEAPVGEVVAIPFRSFMPGALEPEAIIASTSEAFETACEVLHDAGQSEPLREVIARRTTPSTGIGERGPVRSRPVALAGRQAKLVAASHYLTLANKLGTFRLCPYASLERVGMTHHHLVTDQRHALSGHSR